MGEHHTESRPLGCSHFWQHDAVVQVVLPGVCIVELSSQVAGQTQKNTMTDYTLELRLPIILIQNCYCNSNRQQLYY